MADGLIFKDWPMSGQRGKWVLLQNCHLVPSFMATPENLVEKRHPEESNLMLWLDVRASVSTVLRGPQ